MERYDLSVKQGETFDQVLIFKDSDGEVMDLTGAAGYCQVRPEPGSDDLTAEMTVTITAAEGKVTLTIPASETVELEPSVYAWDYAMTLSGTTKYYIGGKFTVYPAVTVINEE